MYNHEIIPPQIIDRDGKLVAVLENATKISYSKVKNGLWTCQFTLSMQDEKREHVQPKHYVELYDHDKRIGRFIVNTRLTEKDDSNESVTYHCDHVLALLHNDIVWGTHKWTGEPTRAVLEGMIALQETKHWRLGDVEFARNFHYKLESGDSLLEAVVGVPKRFAEPYIWAWDDLTYPFTLNLLRPNPKITGTVIAGKNLAGVSIEESAEEMFTRIYPLGDGEGDEQLDITSVNDGVPYLEDTAAIERYGLISRVWEDKRYTNALSLKEDAQERLNKYKQPLKSVEIRAIDYELVDPQALETYEIGSSAIVHDKDTGIDDVLEVEGIEKTDVYGSPQDIKLMFGNLRQELTDTVDVIEKDLTQTQKDAVYKGRVYNGTLITPEDGFVATRSDNMARTVMNATEGLRIQKGDGSGSNWVDVIYLDANGNAEFIGTVRASKIIGDTTIDVGTDLRVGNMIYVGRLRDVDKGIIFSDIAHLRYSNYGLDMIAAGINILATGSANGEMLLSAGREVDVVSEGGMTSVDGISFRIVGEQLLVYHGRQFVGAIEMGDGSVG